MAARWHGPEWFLTGLGGGIARGPLGQWLPPLRLVPWRAFCVALEGPPWLGLPQAYPANPSANRPALDLCNMVFRAGRCPMACHQGKTGGKWAVVARSVLEPNKKPGDRHYALWRQRPDPLF